MRRSAYAKYTVNTLHAQLLAKIHSIHHQPAAGPLNFIPISQRRSSKPDTHVSYTPPSPRARRLYFVHIPHLAWTNFPFLYVCKSERNKPAQAGVLGWIYIFI